MELYLNARVNKLGCFIAWTRVLTAGGPGATVILAGVGMAGWGDQFLAWLDEHRVALALGIIVGVIARAKFAPNDEEESEEEQIDRALESEPGLARIDGNLRYDRPTHPAPTGHLAIPSEPTSDVEELLQPTITVPTRATTMLQPATRIFLLRYDIGK